jgi:hypothetical protein
MLSWHITSQTEVILYYSLLEPDSGVATDIKREIETVVHSEIV